MGLSTSVKVYSCECPICRPSKSGNNNLSQMNIYLVRTVSACQRLPIDYR